MRVCARTCVCARACVCQLPSFSILFVQLDVRFSELFSDPLSVRMIDHAVSVSMIPNIPHTWQISVQTFMSSSIWFCSAILLAFSAAITDFFLRMSFALIRRVSESEWGVGSKVIHTSRTHQVKADSVRPVQLDNKTHAVAKATCMHGMYVWLNWPTQNYFPSKSQPTLFGPSKCLSWDAQRDWAASICVSWSMCLLPVMSVWVRVCVWYA